MTAGLYAVPMARGDTKYGKIAASLLERIESGEFPPGTLLPSEAELQKHYGAAQATVRHAVAVLREAGIAEAERGVGVWVRKPPDRGPSEYDVVIARIAELDERVRRLEELRAEERGERT
jgi:DNA-binding GntR family transcriptional regulator